MPFTTSFYSNGFHWINTPIITGSDCEGAGELFRVSTLDFANLPRTGQGDVDFHQDFFLPVNPSSPYRDNWSWSPIAWR
jgi:aspartyl/asparaginyl-tRNA synthetase